MGRTRNSYDPWRHAQLLGATVIHRRLPNPKMVGAYSPEFDCIYLQPNLTYVVERCALAHEIVHWEHRDTGTKKHELRAERLSAQRLIHPDDLRWHLTVSNDLHQIARDLNVTLSTLHTYLAHVAQHATLNVAV